MGSEGYRSDAVTGLVSLDWARSAADGEIELTPCELTTGRKLED